MGIARSNNAKVLFLLQWHNETGKDYAPFLNYGHYTAYAGNGLGPPCPKGKTLHRRRRDPPK